jgi:hypothetical protein
VANDVSEVIGLYLRSVERRMQSGGRQIGVGMSRPRRFVASFKITANVTCFDLETISQRCSAPQYVDSEPVFNPRQQLRS